MCLQSKPPLAVEARSSQNQPLRYCLAMGHGRVFHCIPWVIDSIPRSEIRRNCGGEWCRRGAKRCSDGQVGEGR